LIIYNSQIRICTNFFDFVGCQSSTQLCTPNAYHLNETVLVDLPNRKFVFQTKNDLYFPPMLKLGDIFQSSYPTLLALFELKNNSDVTKKVEILENIPCNVEACGEYATQKGLRTFAFYSAGVEALSNVKEPLTSFFIDLDETGTLDIITISQKNIFTTMNNYFLDGFFFKILGLNGVTPAFFSKVYGANLPGVTSKITYVDLDGLKFVQTSTQTSQSTYSPLQLPYSHYGIGRTSGYIEEMFVGIPSGVYKLFQGVVPNGQLLVIPYGSDWILEMYVSISGAFLWVCVAFISTLLILSIPIITFVTLEQLNDKKERTSKTSNLSHVFI
jgi:integrin alpha FG-GAP repeat containing protein 1